MRQWVGVSLVALAVGAYRDNTTLRTFYGFGEAEKLGESPKSPLDDFLTVQKWLNRWQDVKYSIPFVVGFKDVLSDRGSGKYMKSVLSFKWDGAHRPAAGLDKQWTAVLKVQDAYWGKERYCAELEMARFAMLNSGLTVAVYGGVRDYDDSEGQKTLANRKLFILFELIGGTNLRGIFGKEPLDQRVAQILVAQGMWILRKWKDNNIVHRDLRLGNVMLTPAVCATNLARLEDFIRLECRIVAIDYGYACFADKTSPLASLTSRHVICDDVQVGLEMYNPRQVELVKLDMHAMSLLLAQMLSSNAQGADDPSDTKNRQYDEKIKTIFTAIQPGIMKDHLENMLRLASSKQAAVETSIQQLWDNERAWDVPIADGWLSYRQWVRHLSDKVMYERFYRPFPFPFPVETALERMVESAAQSAAQ